MLFQMLVAIFRCRIHLWNENVFNSFLYFPIRAVSYGYACIFGATSGIRNELIRNVCDRLLICPHWKVEWSEVMWFVFLRRNGTRNPFPSVLSAPQPPPPTPLLMSGLASVHSAWLPFHKATPHPLSFDGKVTPKKSN